MNPSESYSRLKSLFHRIKESWTDIPPQDQAYIVLSVEIFQRWCMNQFMPNYTTYCTLHDLDVD